MRTLRKVHLFTKKYVTSKGCEIGYAVFPTLQDYLRWNQILSLSEQRPDISAQVISFPVQQTWRSGNLTCFLHRSFKKWWFIPVLYTKWRITSTWCNTYWNHIPSKTDKKQNIEKQDEKKKEGISKLFAGKQL